MQENIEKLISHYECELIKNNSKEEKNILEKVINDLKEVIDKENEKKTPKTNNKKSKKKKNNNTKKQEFVKSSVEPELVPRKIKKEY